MGHPCGSFSRDFFHKDLLNLKLEVFVKGNLSFVEAPWQPFTRTNRSPQSPFLIVEMINSLYH